MTMLHAWSEISNFNFKFSGDDSDACFCHSGNGFLADQSGESIFVRIFGSEKGSDFFVFYPGKAVFGLVVKI